MACTARGSCTEEVEVGECAFVEKATMLIRKTTGRVGSNGERREPVARSGFSRYWQSGLGLPAAAS
jgi:hypothetical protein